ncbi:MAG TPA: ATP-binding protein [Pseudolabrys sp.]|jgi:anti-sigma regulatory factor (Ser/Thr protein kinase)
MTACHVETRIWNRIAEVASVAEIVSEFCAKHDLPEQFLVALGVSLDEALSNIIRYAYGDARDHSILVRLDYEPGSVGATVEDDGRPFDPLSAPALDLTSPTRDRGFGIHFIRHLMDEVRYVRQGGINRLNMRKKIV